MVGNMNLADNALALAVPLEISETNENTNVYSYIPNALKMLYKNISFSFKIFNTSSLDSHPVIVILGAVN